MIAILTSALIAAAGWGNAPEPSPVPQLDFVERVDYVKWFDDAISYASDGNALNNYGVFLYEDPQRRLGNLAPQHGTFADRDLAKRLEVPMHWTADESLGLAKWSHHLERRFAHVVEDADKYQYYATRRRPNQPMLFQIEPPLMGNARLISQMLFIRAWRANQRGVDVKLLPEAIRTCLIMARHFGQGFTPEEQMFSAGQHTFVYDQIRRSMRSRFHMVSEWEKVLQILETYDDQPITRDLGRSLYFSEASTLQLLQHVCSKLGDDGKPQITSNINPDVLKDYLAMKFPNERRRPAADTLAEADPRVLASAVHKYFAGMRDLLSQDFVVGLDEKVAALEEAAFGEHPELNVLTTPVGLSVRSAFRTEAQRRLTYLFLKMAVDFKFDDTWPQSLDEISGSLVSENRIDPYTGKDFLLRNVSITAVPYSVGPDGEDDGGDEAKDVIFWGPVAPEAQYHQKPGVTDGGQTDAGAPDAVQGPQEEPPSEQPE